jgi:putative membrane protein
MDRRLVLAGLAGIAAAPVALAQNTAQPQSPAAQTGGAAGGVHGTAGVTTAGEGGRRVRQGVRQGQIEGHQELLQIQERFLQGRPQSREAMNAAKMARGHIKEHIAMLKGIQEGL